MSESQSAEIQYWQSLVDDMRVSSERVREERDQLRTANEMLHLQNAQMEEELKQLRSMLSRIQVAMSQGIEL